MKKIDLSIADLNYTNRETVMSWVVAMIASTNARVIDFREEYCDGCPMGLDAANEMVEPIRKNWDKEEEWDISWKLHRLHSISLELARDFRWDAEEAMMFILTGKPPRLRAVEARTNGESPPYLRIVLEVDPWVVGSRELSRIYREIQTRVLYTERVHGISEKHTALAVAFSSYVLKKMFSEAKSEEYNWSSISENEWKLLFEKWNSNGKHRYKSFQIFKRDMRVVIKRVTDPPHRIGDTSQQIEFKW